VSVTKNEENKPLPAVNSLPDEEFIMALHKLESLEGGSPERHRFCGI
jgi:hypothetical protein